jgi:hypothetical protein
MIYLEGKRNILPYGSRDGVHFWRFRFSLIIRIPENIRMGFELNGFERTDEIHLK